MTVSESEGCVVVGEILRISWERKRSLPDITEVLAEAIECENEKSRNSCGHVRLRVSGLLQRREEIKWSNDFGQVDAPTFLLQHPNDPVRLESVPHPPAGQQ